MPLGECVCMFLCVGGFVYLCGVYKRCVYVREWGRKRWSLVNVYVYACSEFDSLNYVCLCCQEVVGLDFLSRESLCVC